jgi:hypothetical protein
MPEGVREGVPIGVCDGRSPSSVREEAMSDEQREPSTHGPRRTLASGGSSAPTIKDRRKVQVGYARQKQYKTTKGRRLHAVQSGAGQPWVLLCTGKPGTREYTGWVTTVDCPDCRALLGDPE